MPTVEGLTPGILWTTVYGIIALCLLFMIVYKVYEAVRDIIDRKKKQREAEKPDFAEAVSRKVIEKLEPRFVEIEKELGKEKSRLDNHDVLIANAQAAQKETREGLVAICKYLMAMTQYGNVGGNSKEMKDATAEMTQYLATKIG
jgi:hypothetical protein